jgi:hypothetical protein
MALFDSENVPVSDETAQAIVALIDCNKDG